jgi:hypothetical protein
MACEPPPPGLSPTRSTQTWQTSRDKEAPAQTKGAPNRTNPSSASPEVGPLLPGAYLGKRKQGRSCIYSEQTSASDNTISSFTPHSRQNVRTEKSTLHKKSQLQASTVDEPLPPGVSTQSTLPATHYNTTEERVRVNIEASATEETAPPGASPLVMSSVTQNSNILNFQTVTARKVVI